MKLVKNEEADAVGDIGLGAPTLSSEPVGRSCPNLHRYIVGRRKRVDQI